MDKITEFHINRLRENRLLLVKKYEMARTQLDRQEISKSISNIDCEIADELGVGRANLK